MTELEFNKKKMIKAITDTINKHLSQQIDGCTLSCPLCTEYHSSSYLDSDYVSCSKCPWVLLIGDRCYEKEGTEYAYDPFVECDDIEYHGKFEYNEYITKQSIKRLESWIKRIESGELDDHFSLLPIYVRR